MARPADWALKPGDVPYSAAELAERLEANVLRFYDGGRSEYGPGDRYAFVFADETRVSGTYSIAADGSVCIDFDNGAARCDLYVRNGARELLIDAKGDRYPVK